MTPDQFHKLALSRPEVVEGQHMGVTDFRANGRIVATIGTPEVGWGMIKLTLEQQAMVCLSQPKVFQPFKGGWGRLGCTSVKLAAAKTPEVREALMLAVQNSMEKKPAKPKKRQAKRRKT
jgi:hypothetical protein